MNNPNPDSKPVVDAAKFVFAGNWSGELNEGKASAESKVITRVWQDRMTLVDPEKYKKNVAIWSHLNDKIDLVDFRILHEPLIPKVTGEYPQAVA